MKGSVRGLLLVSWSLSMVLISVTFYYNLTPFFEMLLIEDGKLMADAEAGEFWGLFGGFAPLL